MSADAISADAQATALLVGRFGRGEMKPLSRGEFNRVAQSLHQRGLRPADLFVQVPTDLPVEPDRVEKLISRGTALALAAERWSQLGIGFVSRADPVYPARFRRLLKGSSAPIIFHAGDLSLIERPTVGVVGSRDATDAGLETARRVGERAATEGVAIVSGDARGIDRAAMESALDAGGQVIGILADSLTKSVLSKRYRQAIADGRLLLLSPNEPDARFTVAQAMGRNRYIYAAGDAVIIADSDVRGGTWNGALENQKHRWTTAYVRVGEQSRDGNAALAREGLREWRSSWLDGGSTLASLFRTEDVPSEALPLFAEPEPARGGGGQAEQGEDPAVGAGELLRASASQLDQNTADSEHDGEAPGADRTGEGCRNEPRDANPDVPRGRDFLFAGFLDRLAGALDPCATAAAVAEYFFVEIAQAEAWLSRASRLGKVALRDDHRWEWRS